jgi:uridylate kinase
MAYKRVLLKLSGEALGGPDGSGADGVALQAICNAVQGLVKSGTQVAMVIGGGNFWRFRDNADLKIPREASDAIGMMATVMNARLMAEALNAMGVAATALAAHGNFYFAEPYVPSRAKKLLNEGHVVICGGGTGNPFFTTDSAAALRALELDCDVLLKGTKVDGVYDKDPKMFDDAKFFSVLSYAEVLKRELQVMDLTAITLCMENSLPVHVFNALEPANITLVVSGEKIGTHIS